MKPGTVIYFKTSDSTFVKIDQEILERNFPTVTFHIPVRSKWVYVWSLLKLFFFLVFRTRKASIFFIRFADYHTALMAFISKVLNKKLIVVVGGYEVVKIPAYKYGAFIKGFRGSCVRYTYKNCSVIVPNNHTLVENEDSYLPGNPVRSGVKVFVPDTDSRIKVIHNGYKTDFWRFDPADHKESLILTVGLIENYTMFRKKGIDDFIAVAQALPEHQFLIVGMDPEKVISWELEQPKNLTIISALSPQDLLKWYKRAKVFCLFSIFEGMPNVLSEAMLCECIPVGSRVNFIPEIIGDTGYVVDKKDVKAMVTAVKNALGAGDDLGQKARNRIVREFPLSRREQELVALLKEII